MLLNHLFGIGFLALGLINVTSYSDELAAFRLPLFYRELKPMKERWGETVGTALHILDYVVVPLGFAVLFLLGFVFP